MEFVKSTTVDGDTHDQISDINNKIYTVYLYEYSNICILYINTYKLSSM